LIFNIILGYILFSLSVGITSYFTVYRPIFIKIRDEYDIEIAELEYPLIAAFVLIVMSSISAPFTFWIAITGPDEDLELSITEKLLERDED